MTASEPINGRASASPRECVQSVLQRKTPARIVYAPNYWQCFARHQNQGLLPPYTQCFMLAASCNTSTRTPWQVIKWFRDAWQEFGQ